MSTIYLFSATGDDHEESEDRQRRRRRKGLLPFHTSVLCMLFFGNLLFLWISIDFLCCTFSKISVCSHVLDMRRPKEQPDPVETLDN